jgi:hypothetical protein
VGSSREGGTGAAAFEKNKVEIKAIVLSGVVHEFKGKDGYKDAGPGQMAMSELVKWFKTKLLI